MFIRRINGAIRESFTCRQVEQNEKGEFVDRPGIEEIADDAPELVAFRTRAMPVAKDKTDKLQELLIAKGVIAEADIPNDRKP